MEVDSTTAETSSYVKKLNDYMNKQPNIGLVKQESQEAVDIKLELLQHEECIIKSEIVSIEDKFNSTSSNKLAKMAKFSDEENVKFVELYSLHECLWNTHITLYKNRDARDSALKEIAKELGKKDFNTIKDVTNKIKNLRSTYYQEVKKIEKSTQSGLGTANVYIPKVPWFNILHNCLQHFVNKRKTESNLPIYYEVNNATQEEEEIEEDFQNADNENVSPAPEDENEELENSTISNMELPKSSTSNVTTTSGNKRTFSAISSAIDRLDNIAKSTRAMTTKPDEFDVLGQLVAATLRKLPPTIAAEAEMSIHQILYENKMKTLNSAVARNGPPTYITLENVRSPTYLSDHSNFSKASGSTSMNELTEFMQSEKR